jgi:surface polysaccharide O-acyltransferase-like enzyme
MAAVVVLHLLGRGGVLAAAVPFTAHYGLTWFFESAAYCAVDAYALLTGYLLVRSRCRPGSLIGLWLQVFCYSAGITVLFTLFFEPISPLRLLQACLPVTFTQYWYFTAYFAVYCLAPFFNRLIGALSPAAFRRLLATLLVLLSLIPTVFGADPFVTGDGYSFLWLAALYFLGAYLREYPPRRRRPLVHLGGYGLCLLGLLAFRFAVEAVEFSRTGAVSHGGWLLRYSSPLVVGEAVCLFLLCRDLEVRSRAARGVIGVFDPVAFGVYLFHAQPFIFHRVLDGALTPLLRLPAWQFALAVPGAALGVFLLGAGVDWVRLGVFRLLRLPRLAALLGEKLERRLPPV